MNHLQRVIVASPWGLENTTCKVQTWIAWHFLMNCFWAWMLGMW